MSSLKEKTYIFAGNRAFVFQKMQKLELNIKKIFAVKNSYFERFLISNNLEFEAIENKKSFIEKIKTIDFDYFISNGLPVILPISELKKNNNKQFINIHPSFLPDLRGADPALGSVLYKKDTGATCHYMNDGIDSGDIIAQIKIPYSSELDAGLLYQLSFIAEADVFEMAFNKHFSTEKKQIKQKDDIYYSFKIEDLKIDLQIDSIDNIISKVKAFSTKSKGAEALIEGQKYKIYFADVIENEFVNSILSRYNNLEIMFKYEDFIVLKKDNKCLRLRSFPMQVYY